MGKIANTWLKRIFSVSTLTTIATVVAACIAIIQYVESNGGAFVAFVNNEEAAPPIKNTILVYLDKDSADLSQIGIFPKITNPSKYSLQDVLLTYKINSKSANISYTDYFSVHRVANGEQVTNNDKTLYAKTDMPEPFYYFIVKNHGEAAIDIRATYKGVDEPFTYQADIFARKLYDADYENRKKAIFEDASHFASTQQFSKVDLIILDNEKVETFRDISLNELSENSKPTLPQVDRSNDITNPEQQVTSDNKPEIKTVNEIKAKNEELIKTTKDNQGTPWYMYVVGAIFIILFIISLSANIFAGVLFDESEKAYRIKAVTTFIVSTLFLYLSVYYGLSIFSETPIQRFWLGLIMTYVIAFSFALMFFCTHKTKDYFNVSDDNDGWILIIYLIVIGWPLFFLCKYLIDVIPF